MRIAYYAPMKSPDHPRPSGDRLIARLLIEAMQSKGHHVELMSNLRAWEGHGDLQAQRTIRRKAADIRDQIMLDINTRAEADRPDIWFSYHPYHKAPDWIGPSVAAQLNIPYVIAEAIYAIDHKQGPWSQGLQQMLPTLQQASAVLCLNPLDIPALEKLPQSRDKLHRLPPFLDTRQLSLQADPEHRADMASRYGLDPGLPWIVAVAMMRDDAKLVSYQHLAKSLKSVKQPYQLILIGDGRAREKVEALFNTPAFPPTCYTGQLDQAATFEAMLACDIFVWPAYKEAIGMAILEAQACGLPVVAGNSGTIPGIVAQQQSGFLCAPQDHQSMAENIDRLLANPALRQQFSTSARKKFAEQHSLEAAANRIDEIIEGVRHDWH